MDLKEKLDSIPMITPEAYAMREPNQRVELYSGEFELHLNGDVCRLNGKLFYDWFPYSGVGFSGHTVTPMVGSGLDILDAHELFLDGLKVCNCYITESASGEDDDPVKLEGSAAGQVIIGDQSVSVDRVRFAVPNLRDFHGQAVRVQNGDNVSVNSNRIILNNPDYSIVIDKSPQFVLKHSSLNSKGGYLLLYSGELKPVSGALNYSSTRSVLDCLSLFLSFLNGRRCSPLFREGLFEDNLVWGDYTDYSVDLYKYVPTWPRHMHIEGLDDLWVNFSAMWKDEDSREFLKSALHWYVEANSNSGLVEGSIIMAQTGIELLYNWLVVERKRVITGKDSENISAANKIRLLLSTINLSSMVPDTLSELKDYAGKIPQEQTQDAPEAFVQIRNAIVHSQGKKRKFLSDLPGNIRYQALQLGIWYIELTLLYILGFRGGYANRCLNARWAGNGEEVVPWMR